MKTVKFPQDELAHDHNIEWWYWNGHLKDKLKRSYAFMDCLFKINTKKVGIPYVKELPFKTIFFSHSILSDIEKKKHYPVVDYISVVSKDSFTKDKLYVNYATPFALNGYINKIMEEPRLHEYHIKNEQLDLELKAKKKPLLVGGAGYKKLHQRSTYYYSLTNLQAQGEIYLNGKVIPVSGKAWMDHQWANVVYAKDQWNWFCIQLDNNVEILVFEYIANQNRDYQASIVTASGKQFHTTDVNFTPLEKGWKSAKTKAVYPLRWRIEIPQHGIDLETEPLIRNQEMVYGVINYWEGPLRIKGKMRNKAVTGQGFLEIVGRPAQRPDITMLKQAITKAKQKLK